MNVKNSVSHEHLKCIWRINRNSLKYWGVTTCMLATADADPILAVRILSNPSLLTVFT
jgi:hypothetical protein